MQTQQAQLNAGFFNAGHAMWMQHFGGQLGPAHAAINVNSRGRFTGVTFGNPGADTFTCVGEKGSLAAFVELTSMQGDRATGLLDKSLEIPASIVVHDLTATETTSGRPVVANWLGELGRAPVRSFPARSQSDLLMLSDFRPRVLTAVIEGGVLATKIPNIGLVLTAARRGAFNTGSYFARTAQPYRMGPGRRFSVSGAEYQESHGWFAKTSW